MAKQYQFETLWKNAIDQSNWQSNTVSAPLYAVGKPASTFFATQELKTFSFIFAGITMVLGPDCIIVPNDMKKVLNEEVVPYIRETLSNKTYPLFSAMAKMLSRQQTSAIATAEGLIRLYIHLLQGVPRANEKQKQENVTSRRQLPVVHKAVHLSSSSSDEEIYVPEQPWFIKPGEVTEQQFARLQAARHGYGIQRDPIDKEQLTIAPIRRSRRHSVSPILGELRAIPTKPIPIPRQHVNGTPTPSRRPPMDRTSRATRTSSPDELWE